jgi:UDP:flavonoid glycosyltransferase YjiC (YdhE family)
VRSLFRIAFFISPHGFGHAARAAAIMAALHKADSAFHFEIFTRVPRWFFADSLSGSFAYHSLLTDVGLVQETALREDLTKTLERLNVFLPFDQERVAALASRTKRLDCRLIVCDIAPLGIAVAQAAGIPSVLVENFTWDWIYAGYRRAEARLGKHIAYLRDVFASADYHIQTEPICRYRDADLRAPPVSREPRATRRQVREKLGIPRRAPAVLVTMGGVPGRYAFLERLREQRGVYFVIPGGSLRARTRGNLALLPHYSDFYHPDLVNACDVVVGKLGYSTVAEVYRAGVPLLYVPRARFRESPVVGKFVRRYMRGIEISEVRFKNGDWLRDLPRALALPRRSRREPNGAVVVARFIRELLDK